MPSFASLAALLVIFRFYFWFFIPILFSTVGVLLSYSSPFQASSAMFWPLTVLTVILIIIYAIAARVIMPSLPFPSFADLLRCIPRHEGFGNLIQELTLIVERNFPHSSPLDENSARAWIFMASRSIYRYTGDVISGSLACAVLISFLISRRETPTYVFIIWAICVVSYLKNNEEAIPGNDSDSTSA